MKDRWIILAVAALLMGALFVAGMVGVRQRGALMAEMKANGQAAPEAETGR